MIAIGSAGSFCVRERVSFSIRPFFRTGRFTSIRHASRLLSKT